MWRYPQPFPSFASQQGLLLMASSIYVCCGYFLWGRMYRELLVSHRCFRGRLLKWHRLRFHEPWEDPPSSFFSLAVIGGVQGKQLVCIPVGDRLHPCCLCSSAHLYIQKCLEALHTSCPRWAGGHPPSGPLAWACSLLSQVPWTDSSSCDSTCMREPVHSVISGSPCPFLSAED